MKVGKKIVWKVIDEKVKQIRRKEWKMRREGEVD